MGDTSLRHEDAVVDYFIKLQETQVTEIGRSKDSNFSSSDLPMPINLTTPIIEQPNRNNRDVNVVTNPNDSFSINHNLSIHGISVDYNNTQENIDENPIALTVKSQIKNEYAISDSLSFNERNMMDEMPLGRKIMIPTNQLSTSQMTEDDASLIKNKQCKRKLVVKRKGRSSKKMKKSKIDYEKFIEESDQTILFNLLSKELDAQTILLKYKEKRNEWSKDRIQSETSRILNINLNNDSSNSDKKSSHLQKTLEGLYNYVGHDFIEAIVNVCGYELKAKILENLNTDEIIDILENFGTMELANILKVYKHEILESVSVDDILNLMKSKTDLNKSEELFNQVLQNGPEVLSEENEQNVKDVLIKKYNIHSLRYLIHDVIDMCMVQPNR
ncbi:uncharacterized protein LOC131670953 isoform X2 [Phymastichus coffea]|uniref:uncharacterized protein LOC131670953 isoform X2 n=1 Tax=Phymastichus coffea TaxID=108790 RepID=UPI00273C8503|nr:uncharacterized protein LOC131670953 isoform X2 [Phymastichus coffea]